MTIANIWEFFIWPLAVILVSGLIIYIVRQFKRSLKLIIDYESSSTMIYDNRNYIIYNSNLINKGKNVIYNISIESIPLYDILPSIQTLIENDPNDPVQIIGFRDVVDNPFNLTDLVKLEPGENIQGNLIFEVPSEESRIEKIIFRYADKEYIKRIRQKNLKILQP